MKYSQYGAVIVGSGLSGLYTALKISEQLKNKEKILIVTKSPLGESNSRYAQGGMACVTNQNEKDSIDLHINDTLKSGLGLCEQETVNEYCEISKTVLEDLISKGVHFDKSANGNFAYTHAGGHSTKRVLHSGGDSTGREIINVLTNAVKNSKNIDILEKTMAVELLVSKNKECNGIIIYNKNNQEHEIIFSSTIILATGGVGQIYKYTTNPYGATADGIAIAYQAGAVIRDMEFVQFHPTALATNPNSKTRYLISEALRGEGAKLKDKNGNEFMSKYDQRKELAPRDIVTRAIFSEMQTTNEKNVFLDATGINNEQLVKQFPNITQKCKSLGIDITKDYIPVAPAAHYIIGGIKAKINGQTTIKGLYAIGENASLGFHGANRLATNSILECVTSAYTLTQNLNINSQKKFDTTDKNIKSTIEQYSKESTSDIYDLNLLKNNLRDIMWNKVGIIRTEENLKQAKKEIEKLKADFKRDRKCLNIGEYEYRNMLEVSWLIVESALKRQESRGAHYRKDYPQTNNIAQHTDLSIE